MKSILSFSAIFALALIAMVESVPVQDFPQISTLDNPMYEPAVVVRGDRHRRVTCDLLSFDTKWGSLNHAACAAHCLAMMKGYRGGHCDGNGVCVCRR